MIKVISVVSIHNNAMRAQFNGIWDNVMERGEKVYNPKSVTIELDGHIEHGLMNKLSVIMDGSMSGDALLLKGEDICKTQSVASKLRVVSGEKYLVVRQMDKATNKMMSYRHSGFTHRKTGELIDRTYIKLEIVEPDKSAVVVEDI